MKRANSSSDMMLSYQEIARKRAEEKRRADLEHLKKMRRKKALSRGLEFDPDLMRPCTVQPPLDGLFPEDAMMGRRIDQRCAVSQHPDI